MTLNIQLYTHTQTVSNIIQSLKIDTLAKRLVSDLSLYVVYDMCICVRQNKSLIISEYGASGKL